MEWISVEDNQPPYLAKIDVWSQSQGRITDVEYQGLTIRGGEYIKNGFWIDDVTHYSIPEPPKDSDNVYIRPH